MLLQRVEFEHVFLVLLRQLGNLFLNVLFFLLFLLIELFDLLFQAGRQLFPRAVFEGTCGFAVRTVPSLLVGELCTISQIVTESRTSLQKGFKPSHVNQMLASLSASGLIYKNRHGKYMFAVPLLHEFIRRQMPY